MLSGLAGKLFGSITPTTYSNKTEDLGDDEVVVATASQDQELSDSEEWVLLDDDEVSDRSSILGELELVVNDSPPPSNDDSSSLNFSPNSDGWNVEPPPCFQSRPNVGGGFSAEEQHQQKGRNKYKNTTKHQNPNLQRSIQKQHQQKFGGGVTVKKRPARKTMAKIAAGGDAADDHICRPVDNFDDVMDVSVLENMLIECPMPTIRKIEKCEERPTTYAVTRRPLTSNNNQAVITPTTTIIEKKPAPIHKILSASIIDRPLRPPPFRRQVKAPKLALDDRQTPAEDDKKENKPPQPAPCGAPAPAAPVVKKAASKSNLTYVITGLSVCAMKPCPAAAAALASVQQASSLPLLQDKRAAAAVATSACAPHLNRRGGMKRQNFTVYDASLFGKGKQRKDRIKNFSGRSNDRRRQ